MAEMEAETLISTSENERIISARDQQQEFYNVFGYQNEIIWDCYDKDDKDSLLLKVKLIICNDENNDKLNKMIDNIVESIWNQRKYSGGILLMSVIFVLTVEYTKYKENLNESANSVKFTMHPLFRIRKCLNLKNREDSHNCCMIFVDEAGRVYQNWNDYIEDNTLPKEILVAPKKGIYNCDDQGKVLLEINKSPECSVGRTAVQVADIGTTAASLGSAGILIASIATAPIAAPVLAGAAIVGLGCGAYSLIRSSFSLRNRYTHEQSVSLADSDARGNWIGIAGGLTGIAAGGVTQGVAHLARNGENIGMAVRATANVVNATAIIINGGGVVNGVFGVFVRYRDDQEISALDVVQLASSMFLLTHSVYNFQTANNIIKTNQDYAIGRMREDLSRNQKRAFDKMSKETIRLGGERSDIIRSLKKIPDQKTFFRDVYKINKDLNKNNVRISFSADGKAILNNADSVHPSTLRNLLKQDAPSVVFASVPPIPEGNTVSVNELNLNTLPNNIDQQSLNKVLAGISQIYKVFNTDDLRNNIINFLEILTVKAFNTLFDFVKFFVRNSGDTIQIRLHRVIPFETFFHDIFEVIKKLIGVECKDWSSYLEEVIEFNRDFLIEQINAFYDNFRSKSNFSGVCKVCGGNFNIDEK